jgi:glutathione peroxidase
MRVLTATGAEMPLAQYTGKVLLIVNVASKCGFTKQYEGLQALHDKYREQDFEILAFPCNQFKGQEPGFDQEIQTFCRTVYGVRFPVFAKIEVNGDGAHPLYKYLKKAAPGLAGTENVKWNFTKFLVAQDGTVVRRFASATKPRDLVSHIDDQLAE